MAFADIIQASPEPLKSFLANHVPDAHAESVVQAYYLGAEIAVHAILAGIRTSSRASSDFRDQSRTTLNKKLPGVATTVQTTRWHKEAFNLGMFATIRPQVRRH